MELDTLEQRAADNSINRLQDLLDAIGICATAVEMGPGAVASVADHLKYSRTTVRRLAAMHDLPEDCIDLNVKPGVYWAVLLYAEEAEIEPVDFIRTRVIPEQMTPAEAKRAMGIEVIRESALDKLNAELDALREERQKAAMLLSGAVGNFSSLVEGIRLLLLRHREAEAK
jgi:hypothetical protein